MTQTNQKRPICGWGGGGHLKAKTIKSNKKISKHATKEKNSEIRKLAISGHFGQIIVRQMVKSRLFWNINRCLQKIKPTHKPFYNHGL